MSSSSSNAAATRSQLHPRVEKDDGVRSAGDPMLRKPIPRNPDPGLPVLARKEAAANHLSSRILFRHPVKLNSNMPGKHFTSSVCRVGWPLADGVTDDALERQLFGRAGVTQGQRRRVEWLGLLLEYELTLRRQKQFETRARVAKLRSAREQSG